MQNRIGRPSSELTAIFGWNWREVSGIFARMSDEMQKRFETGGYEVGPHGINRV